METKTWWSAPVLEYARCSSERSVKAEVPSRKEQIAATKCGSPFSRPGDECRTKPPASPAHTSLPSPLGAKAVQCSGSGTQGQGRGREALREA